MKRFNKGLGLLLLFCCFLPATAQNSPPREDQQFWTEVQLVKPLTKTKDLILIGVLRLGRDWQRPVDERIGAAIAFKLNQYLTLTPTYLYVDQQPFAGRRINEHRLILNATGKLRLGKITFTDRNLYERRVRHNSPDFTLYRNRLQIDHPARSSSKLFWQMRSFIRPRRAERTAAGRAGLATASPRGFLNNSARTSTESFSICIKWTAFHVRAIYMRSEPYSVSRLTEAARSRPTVV
jgi:hypothetical protein